MNKNEMTFPPLLPAEKVYKCTYNSMHLHYSHDGRTLANTVFNGEFRM